MIHLHGHSTYSFLEAIGSPKEIAIRAKELDMPAIALTDYQGCYWLIDFYLKAKAEKIKPLMGVELAFVVDLESQIKNSLIGNINFLAKNENGYHSILRLASFANMEWLDDIRRVDMNAIKKFKDDIYIFMWGENSWIGKMILGNESEQKIIDILQMLIDAYGKENVFLEVIAQDYRNLPQVKKINDGIMSLSKKLWLKKIIGNNYHYLRREDKDAREMALAIKDNYKMYDEQRRKPKGQYYIMSEADIRIVMKNNGFTDKETNLLITQNQQIADSIDIDIELWKTLFPNYETPEELKKIYEQYKDELVEEK